ncbi:hypothetical protein [Bacillus atrophaeus]|uniref:hypothetical protein n=1 Tax=Bacillus atrophaeus TaxID=1452 RepID=UPI0040423F92
MKENERIQYLLEMLNCTIQYNDTDSYDEITNELKQSLFAPKAFDEITKKGRIHEYGKAAAEAKGIDRKMLDAVKNAPVQLIEGDLYRANRIKDDLLSIIDELLKYKFTDEVGRPLHHALPFQQLAEIANYHIDTDRYFYRNGTKVVESLK